MDKKSYIKPMIEVVELESKALMSIGGSMDEEALRNDGYINDYEQFGRGRRGKWGDLWYEE